MNARLARRVCRWVDAGQRCLVSDRGRVVIRVTAKAEQGISKVLFHLVLR